jgi:drug/metabolite transporter (DMT)-like permease
MLMGSLVMLPIGGLAAPEQLASAPAVPFAAMIALAVVATAIATVVFLKLVVVAGPSFTSFINYLIPVWALVMGVAFLDERPAATVVLGLALILSGIALGEVGARRMALQEARQRPRGSS